MLVRVIVVVPTTKGLHVLPSVEHSRETDGAEPFFAIATVEFASYAVKQSQSPVSTTMLPIFVGISSGVIVPDTPHSLIAFAMS